MDRERIMSKSDLMELVRKRDVCSGGGSVKCRSCGVRHECRLDEAGMAAEAALRFGASLEEYYRGECRYEEGHDVMRARAVSYELLALGGWM